MMRAPCLFRTQAKALAVNEGHLQGELDGAVLALQERAALLDALNAKLTSVGETLDSFEHELQARRGPTWGLSSADIQTKLGQDTQWRCVIFVTKQRGRLEWYRQRAL